MGLETTNRSRLISFEFSRPPSARGSFAWRAKVAGLLLGVALATEAHATPTAAEGGPDAWIERLRHPDPSVRRGAAWLLGRYTLFTPVDRETPNQDQRNGVARQLGNLLDRETDRGVVLAAVATLARWRTPASLRILETLARSATAAPETRASALRALGTCCDSNVRHAVLVELARRGNGVLPSGEVAEVAARTLAEASQEAFTTAMQPPVPSPNSRAGLYDAIGYRGDARWGATLIEALRSTGRPSNLTAQLAAIEAVARLRLVEAAPALLQIAQSESDRAVRRAALRALGALGGGFDVESLRPFLEDPATRGPALEALGDLGAASLARIGDARAVQALSTRARREVDDGVRAALWHAVARIGGRESLDALARSGDDASARWGIVEALLRDPSSRGVTEVDRAFDEDDAPARWARALSGREPDLRALASASPDARIASALALGHVTRRVAETEAALVAALDREDDPGVAVALVEALGSLGAREDVPMRVRAAACGALLERASREREDPSLTTLAAVEALGRARVASAESVIADVARSTDPRVRAAAFHALGLLGASRSRAVIERAVDFDDDAHARGAAAVALARIEGAGALARIRDARMTAWTGDLIERITLAQSIARGERVGDGTGTGVLRAGGAPSRSVWARVGADGGIRLAIAAPDGEMLMLGAPSADEGDLWRLDGPVTGR
jgi:HEAT repeat protein